MPPKVSARAFKAMINVWPAIRGTGQWVTHVAPDYSEIRVKLPLSLRTRNYVGTIFGGSMYGACDPHHMLMLINRLGPDYVVWDKAASIRFRRPGRSTLYATFRVPDEEVAEIMRILETEPKVDRQYSVELKDRSGTVCAVVDKTIHISRKVGERRPAPPRAGNRGMPG